MRDAHGEIWRTLPPIRHGGCGRPRLVYLGRYGIRASCLPSYARTRDALLCDHGITLRLAAIERAKSSRAAGDAWRRAVQRALAAGRGGW